MHVARSAVTLSPLSRWLPWLTALLVLCAGLGIGLALGKLDAERSRSEARGRAILELIAVQAQLDHVLKESLRGTEGIIHLVQYQGDLPQALFESLAAQAIRNHRQIRNIAYAPGNVITRIYPLAGNERALGLDYRTIPEQWRTVERAREQAEPVLGGPVDLVQGGRGLIVRAPVIRQGSGDYWGTVSVVGDVERILEDGGIRDSRTLRIAVRGKDGLGEQGDAIAGDPDVFDLDPVKANVIVPGGSWALAAVPTGGWPSQAPADSPYFRLAMLNAFIFALLGGLLVGRHGQSKRSEQALQLASTVVENTMDGVIVTDAQGRIIATNPAFTEITGYLAEEATGHTPRMLKSNRHGAEFYQHLWASITTTGAWQGEVWNRRKNGEIFPEWLAISAVRDGAGAIRNFVAVFSDISTIKRTQADLEHLAHFDPLTDLPNRVLFQDRMQHAIDRARRYGHGIALLLLDLDGFKFINDSLGHPVGDQLLQLAARRLAEAVRVEDTVARLGGDEFAVILSELADESDAVEAVEAVGRILAAIREPFEMADGNGMVTTSIGISVYPGDGDSVTDLVRNADAAMYEAKNAGRNTYRFYQRRMTEDAQQRLATENALRRALARGEFEVWFQPQFRLGDGAYLGAEALLRWRDPERGLVPPNEFIPIAERSGLIVPLGEQVLEMVGATARRWLDRGLDAGRLAVNVAGMQVDRGDFVASLKRVIDTYALPSSSLEIEITETLIMENPIHARAVLDGIQALGVTTAIDDFGTGYSSLAYLKELPIDTIKLDRAFVKDLPDDRSDIAISRAVIALGHNLGFKVIAEGIETEAQRRFLLEAGCDEGQGFLFARPMPQAAFEAWLCAGCVSLPVEA